MIKGLGRAALGTARMTGRTARGVGKGVYATGNRLGSSKTGLAVLGAGAFAAGIGSTDPVKAGISTFEESVMGDPNFSRSILGDQLGPGAALGFPGSTLGYIGRTSINNAIRYRNVSSHMRETAPGSMVFGMFNSRM